MEVGLHQEEYSSEDEVANPYEILISLVKETSNAKDSSSDSDDELVVKPKRQKISTKEFDEKIENESSDTDENQSDDAGSDCLAKESESDQEEYGKEDANGAEMLVFGESDDEDFGRHGSQSDTDFYKQHTDSNIADKVAEMEKLKPQLVKHLQWSAMETLRHTQRNTNLCCALPEKPMSKKLTQESLRNVYHVRKILTDNWVEMHKAERKNKNELFNPLQRELFTLFNAYADVCYSNADSIKNSQNIQRAYCLHVANHVLRSRAKVLLNSARLRQMTPEQKEQAEYRDQGITRPKVLILVPFKATALGVVDSLLRLFKRGNRFEVGYKKRFYEEFGKDDEDDGTRTLEKKPEDYRNLFAGNIEEHFRIGIALLRNSVRLYAPFYSSDIIVASPLGLRTIIGTEGEKHYEHDFLSSIEIIIMDHTDVFLMQNWEHILHILQHLNLPPKESHGVDFSRVRNISLDGFDKFYRQTISISSVALPQISSVFTKSCWNYKGCFTAEGMSDKGSICAIAKQLPQVYHKMTPVSLVDAAEVRFRFFIDRIYKQYKESKVTHTLIYIPQYFDFVRLRNFMRKEWKSGAGPIFVHINDYSTPSEAGKAKRRFFTGKCSMMLYTERFHFYNRAKIRGMRNLVFYELPTYPQFYAELCNMVREIDGSGTGSIGNAGSVIAMYSKFDTRKLVGTVGLARCRELQASTKSVHMFVTGASS